MRKNHKALKGALRPPIGLAITKALVEGLGGRVAVSSEVGEGTTFDVTLPAAPN